MCLSKRKTIEVKSIDSAVSSYQFLHVGMLLEHDIYYYRYQLLTHSQKTELLYPRMDFCAICTYVSSHLSLKSANMHIRTYTNVLLEDGKPSIGIGQSV